MKTADRLSQALGANIAESMGARWTGGDQPNHPFPTSQVVHGGPASEKYRGAARIKDAFAIELARVAPDPDQPRKEFDEESLDRLAESLKGRGQLQPIRVRYDEAQGIWVIVSGERRFRAAQRAGIATLICVEVKGTPTPEEVLEDQLVENCVREDLKPIEQARAFKALLERRGYSYRQLGEALSISHQAVVRAMALLDLPADIQEKVDAGVVPTSAAAEAARIEDEAEQRAIIARVESGEMTRDEVTRAVRERTSASAGRQGRGGGKGGSRAKPRPPIDERPRRAANNVKVRIEASHRHTLADVIAALREIADRLEADKAQEAA
jgi:ParB family chromosome partitioning protein